MHAAVGANSGQKIQRDQKPNCHFWRARSKHRVLGTKAGYWTCPLHTTPPKGWAKHLSHPCSPTPGHTPTLTPCKDQASPSQWASEQGNLSFVLTPRCCSRGRNKALPEFLVWLLVNFYWWGKAKNPGRYQYYILIWYIIWFPVISRDNFTRSFILRITFCLVPKSMSFILGIFVCVFITAVSHSVINFCISHLILSYDTITK